MNGNSRRPHMPVASLPDTPPSQTRPAGPRAATALTAPTSYVNPTQIIDAAFATYGDWRDTGTLNDEFGNVIESLVRLRDEGNTGNTWESDGFFNIIDKVQKERDKNNKDGDNQTAACADCENHTEHLCIRADGRVYYRGYNRSNVGGIIPSIFKRAEYVEIFLGHLHTESNLVWKQYFDGENKIHRRAVPLAILQDIVDGNSTPITHREWDTRLAGENLFSLVNVRDSKRHLRPRGSLTSTTVGESFPLSQAELNAIISNAYVNNACMAFHIAKEPGKISDDAAMGMLLELLAKNKAFMDSLKSKPPIAEIGVGVTAVGAGASIWSLTKYNSLLGKIGTYGGALAGFAGIALAAQDIEKYTATTKEGRFPDVYNKCSMNLSGYENHWGDGVLGGFSATTENSGRKITDLGSTAEAFWLRQANSNSVYFFYRASADKDWHLTCFETTSKADDNGFTIDEIAVITMKVLCEEKQNEGEEQNEN